MIIAPDRFRDEEYLHPREEFEKTEHKVTVASLETGVCVGMFGAEATARAAVRDVSADDYDAIILVGGQGASALAVPEVFKLYQDAQAKGKIMAAICVSPMILAKAGVLKGKRVTVFKTPDTLKALEDGGAEFFDTPVVVDGKTVTGNGPEAARDFAREIINLLA